ncbi:DoxX family membrane protein [bacterium]|jgi:putative oxidoreductase|nr:DoxX family membrane protein [bacterium]
MKKTVIGVRFLLGLAFVIFGLNGFLNFMPMPPMPAEAGAFLGGLAGSGYFFPFLKIVEILCGLGLVLGLFVPLSLVILTPIMVNIILFHAFLAPAGLGMPIMLLSMHLFLAWKTKDSYAALLKMK